LSHLLLLPRRTITRILFLHTPYQRASRRAGKTRIVAYIIRAAQ